MYMCLFLVGGGATPPISLRGDLYIAFCSKKRNILRDFRSFLIHKSDFLLARAISWDKKPSPEESPV
jgi:hypothetical protein